MKEHALAPSERGGRWDMLALLVSFRGVRASRIRLKDCGWEGC